MAWDDPNNFEFPVQVMCAQKNRIKVFWDYWFLAGQLWSSNFYAYWNQIWPDRFKPNMTIESWLKEEYDDTATPPEVPGVLWQYVPGGGYVAINAANAIPPFETDIRHDLTPKTKWATIPSWYAIRDALDAQMYQVDPTPYFPSWGDGRYYRQEFVDFVLARSKKVYDGETQFPHGNKCFFGAGRVSPRSDINLPEGEHKNWVYFVTNTETTKVTLYMVKCGCLCCPPCGCNKPGNAPGEE